MLIDFSIQNFGAIKDKQTLSFEADKSEQLEDYYVIRVTEEIRLLKMGLIYGANASGKTTVLNALEFLRDIILDPQEKKSDKLDYNPFLFDKDTPNENTILSINFVQQKIHYNYEVVFNEDCVVSEELNFYNPNKASVFKRTTIVDKQLSEIKFGSKIKVSKSVEKALELNTLWNNTVIGAYIKTNVELKELKDTFDWFSEYLKPMIFTRTDLDRYVTSKIDKKEIDKEDVLFVLKQADFNISDIVIDKEEKDLPKGFLEFVEKQIKEPSDKIQELKTKGKITSFDLKLEHTIGGVKYHLPFDLESEGTKRYYGFAGILGLLINSSTLIPMDELESSLHPDLFTHFILSFLMNSKNSQILATTHNREILNDRDIFRNDSIWFAEKENTGATQLYSLADFDSSVIRDTSNVLKAYKAGKLGAVPNLGDYYIGSKNESE
jgi:AAA15 family ATPase/GTPase